MTRKERTRKERQDASEILFYEVTMLHNLSCHMNSLLQENTIIGTALLEAFSVHTAALIDFFYSENPRPDDTIAEDYFGSAEEWRSIRPVKSQMLELVTTRVGREVAHLSYLRTEVVPVLKGCDYCQIATEIRTTFRKFLDAAPGELLGTHCGEFKHHEFEDDEQSGK